MKAKKRLKAGQVEEKQDLLADSDDEGKEVVHTAEIKINKTFAERYEQRKRRELLSKNKEILNELSEESTSEEEDEDAALVTPQVEKKLLKVLNLIKQKDPKIYNPKKVFFKDSDFEQETKETDKDEAKPMRYRDVMRQTLTEAGASAFVDEEEELEKKNNKVKEPTYHEELASLKKSFLEAAEAEDGEGEALLQIKKKSKEDEEQEESEFKQFLGSKNAQKGVDSEAVLFRFWADDESLDPNERFLRDYILNQTWREDKAIPAWQTVEGVDDEEDGQQLEEADAFEATYNFRFEEEGGCEIKGHPRVVTESVRQVNDKRKRARDKKNRQKEEENIRRQEELKRLKSIKREEIRQRIKHIQEVGGLDVSTIKSVLNLEADFDPDTHDEEMQKLFGEEYEAQHEKRSCLEMPESCADILSIAHETASETLTKKQRRLLKLQRKREKQAETALGYADDDAAQHEETGGEGQGEEPTDAANQCEIEKSEEETQQSEWWMCDGCGKGIRGGKKRFDCTKCDNFTLCKVCFRNVRHPHQLVRRTVPAHCNPPKDFEGGAAAAEAPAELNAILDEYFQLDYEDIIGGDLPTRFKYRKVEPANYGITTEEILNSADAELNSKVSLKKLATYREHEKGDDVAAKPWLQPRRQEGVQKFKTDTKMKRKDKTDRTMTPFGVRQDRLKAYDA